MTVALSSIAVMGAAGLAIDLGRMYISKNEAQAFTDLAAVAAALQLNATDAGLENARNVVTNDANRWNFGYNTFDNTTIEFATNKDGPWEEDPSTAANYGYARVTTTVAVPMTFMRVVGSGPTSPVAARSIAGQLNVTSFREGLFPFSPFAHLDPTTQIGGADPVSGLTPGVSYTLRWGAGTQLNKHNTYCPGDEYQTMIDIARAGGGDERGFIESTSASLIRQTIVYDYQTVFREVGDSVVMSGGAKQTQQDALIARVGQDTDGVSSTWEEYFVDGNPAGGGNFRRLVAAPINVGQPGGYEIVDIGSFFLYPAGTYEGATGGNKAFCAEYVGSYVEGGSGPGAYSSGYYKVRLVE